MLDVMVSYLWPEGMMQYTVVGAEAAAADPNDRPDLVFKTSDGYITAGTISDSEWQGFCRASGDPELAKDARFATPAARSVNATARIHRMAEYIGQHTTAEWLERLDAADVPCAPILRRSEIIGNEQVVARGIIAEFEQPTVGRVRQSKRPRRELEPKSKGEEQVHDRSNQSRTAGRCWRRNRRRGRKTLRRGRVRRLHRAA
jgi:crotonobetainyl-CoA:carnitine CoA-transferase CaiB-like acyl-CoA transferase